MNIPEHLSPTQKHIIQRSYDRLQALPDTQTTMLALATLIEHTSDIPIGLRLPLSATLKKRAGIEV